MKSGRKRNSKRFIIPACVIAGIFAVLVLYAAGNADCGYSLMAETSSERTAAESSSEQAAASSQTVISEIENPEETAVSGREEEPEDIVSVPSEPEHEELIEDAEPPLEIDWENLLSEGPDVVGYLYIDLLPAVSYPICFSGDNDYYLHHNYKGEEVFAGAIFADELNLPDFCDPNTLLYGHNMANGTMFGSLRFMDDQETYDSDPYFWILTPNGNYRYHIFSMFFTQVNSDAYVLYGSNGTDFLEWEQLMQKCSDVKNDVPLYEDDKVVYMSTCTADSSKRFVVFGKCVSSEKPTELYDRATGRLLSDSDDPEHEPVSSADQAASSEDQITSFEEHEPASSEEHVSSSENQATLSDDQTASSADQAVSSEDQVMSSEEQEADLRMTEEYDTSSGLSEFGLKVESPYG